MQDSQPTIPDGYKQTDVGIIPEDWDYRHLATCLALPIQNGVFYEPARKGRGCKLINVGDLYSESPIPSETLELFDARKDEIARFGVETGDVFFTRSSITPDGIAHCNVYKKGKDEDVVFDSHIIRVRVNTNKLNPFFLFRYCVSSEARKYFVSNAKTTTMATIDQSVIAKLRVLVPPLPEQQAIAEVLSDVDALVTSLDRLIAKKRNLKQGAMQLLLTGKKRLVAEAKKGYKQTDVGIIPEDWEVKQLGDLFEITSSKRVFQSEWKTEGIPFYRARELAVLGENGYVDNELFISREMYNAFKKGYGIPKIGDMLVTGVGTLGKVYVVSDHHEFYFKDGNIIWFKTSGKVEPYYLKQLYLTRLITKQIEDASAGTTVGTYTISGAKRTIIPFPPLAEQKAIARILSDMDAEIEALEKRREKYKAIKQGMMQELLTGKTRLVDKS